MITDEKDSIIKQLEEELATVKEELEEYKRQINLIYDAKNIAAEELAERIADKIKEQIQNEIDNMENKDDIDYLIYEHMISEMNELEDIDNLTIKAYNSLKYESDIFDDKFTDIVENKIYEVLGLER